MRASPCHSHRTPGAFTLVELLVSMAVLGLLLLLLAQVSGVMGDTWSLAQGRAERRQHGRALVDQIARDLRAAALPVDTRTVSAGPDLQFLMNPSQIGVSWKNPHALFWQAPVATDTSQGDMAVVGYFVRWDNSGPVPRANLCRLFLNPGEPHHRIYERGASTSWLEESMLLEMAPADRAHAYRGLFAENVAGFWARCLDGQGNPVSNDSGGGFDSRADYVAMDRTGASVVHKAPVLPYSVEISLLLLDSRAAASMNSARQQALMALVAQSLNADDCLGRIQRSSLNRELISGTSGQVLRVGMEGAP